MRPIRSRTVRIGGASKAQLRLLLDERGIGLNAYATILFDDPAFMTSEQSRQVVVAEISVAELGLTSGATSDEIFRTALEYGLDVCPLELAPHLRLQYPEQEEGPYLTIASAKTRADEAYPNGFYLRRHDGKLWLRGYRATADYVWSPASRFVFVVDGRAQNEQDND